MLMATVRNGWVSALTLMMRAYYGLWRRSKKVVNELDVGDLWKNDKQRVAWADLQLVPVYPDRTMLVSDVI